MSACMRMGRLVVVCYLIAPAVVWAQQPSSRPAERDRKPGTYVKLGLAHWQGNIFREGSLTQWTVDLFGANYDLTSVNVGIERYFGGTLLFSGLSIGYRKDAVQYLDSGHMFSAGLFRDIDFKLAALKAAGGVEWGLPSLNFDRTEFDLSRDDVVRYRHTHPDRNTYIPFVGTRSDGAVYPFFEVSAVQRPGNVLLEAGMRINVIRFHFDDYEVGPGDNVRHAFNQSRVLVPYLFVNVGFRMF